MSGLLHRVDVSTPGASTAANYPVFIGSGVLKQAVPALESFCHGAQVLVVSNSTVAPLYLDRLLALLPNKALSHCILPDGESHKNLQQAERIFTALSALRASRDVTLIALGGGMIGDITGFAASLWMRGVNFIQVPTTLLAMVDSSVGGKTAVNLAAGKNLIGAFWQPVAVFADTDLLDTLPARELSAGFAEVLKYGAINDADFFAWLEQNVNVLMHKEPTLLSEAIRRSVQNKADVVGRDPLERGERMLLNFGHTFGHALELAGNYGGILHGEAVAIGMLAAAHLSAQLHPNLAVDGQHTLRLQNLIRAFGLPQKPAFATRSEELLAHMKLDKKSLSGQLRLIPWRGIGQAYVGNASDEQILRAWAAIL
jgi:3-dehydroquinate synthase